MSKIKNKGDRLGACVMPVMKINGAEIRSEIFNFWYSFTCINEAKGFIQFLHTLGVILTPNQDFLTAFIFPCLLVNPHIGSNVFTKFTNEYNK